MEKKEPLPYATPLPEVIIKIQKSIQNPNIGSVKSTVLKNGPRTYKIATLYEIRHSTKPSHYSLRIDSVDQYKKIGWSSKPDHSIQLSDESGEIKSLYELLDAYAKNALPDKQGAYKVVEAEEYQKIAAILEVIPKMASKDKFQLLSAIFSKIEASPEYIADLIKVLEGNSSEALRSLSVASRYIEYKAAYQKLVLMLEEEQTKEATFQDFLSQNPWMFGSEYSELLDRRVWVRDYALDFMVRRTTDGYLELIEIKKASKDKLMLLDAGRKSHYPSQQISQALGQVMNYIGKIEASRDSIKANDNVDVSKIRARIVVGRDGTPEEQNALRSLNAHLHGIEVLTYDQLSRIALRTLSFFEQSIPGIKVANIPDDDLPF